MVLTSEAKAGAFVDGAESSVFPLDELSITSGLIAPPTGDTPDTPTDTEEPTAPSVEVPVNTTVNEIEGAKISEDAVIVAEDGTKVSLENIVLKIQPANADALAKIEAALQQNSTVMDNAFKTQYLEITLEENGKTVKLQNGKIQITMKHDTTVDLSKYDVNVFHVKEDGTIEILAVTSGTESFVFETEGLSPFMIVYKDKAVQTPDQSGDVPTGDTTSRSPFVFMIIIIAAIAAGVYFYNKKRKSSC